MSLTQRLALLHALILDGDLTQAARWCDITLAYVEQFKSLQADALECL